MSVERHVRDAVGRQVRGARGHQRLARGLIDPRIQPMRDHVVKFAKPSGGRVANVGDVKLDVAQPECQHVAACLLDRAMGQVDADQPGARQPVGHAEQVRSGATAELQYPATGDPRRVETVQESDCRELVGMARRMREARVRDLVVERLLRHSR